MRLLQQTNMCIKRFITGIILYLCFDYTHQYHIHHHDMSIKRSFSNGKDWDFLVFTQSWPESVCRVWTHKKPKHHCAFPKTDTWTIHGIWPSTPDGMGPFNCNSTWLFDPEQVRPIEAELEQAWTNVEKETSLYDLWAHEWNKHGTCAAMIEPLNSELKYFSKGLELLKQYTMTEMLRASNITPSDTVELKAEDINKAVVTKLGVRPFIACEFEDKKQYIKELRICFDKQFRLMECLGDKEENGLLTTCNISRGIIYPTRQPPAKRYLVQLYKFVNWVQWFTL